MAVRLEFLDFISRFSVRDGCRVADVACSSCGLMFEEELETAKEKAGSGLGLLCLCCDGDALAVSPQVVDLEAG